MSSDAVASWLRNQKGVKRVEFVPDSLLKRLASEEHGIVSSFGAPVKCTGMEDCLSKDTVLVAFTCPDFWTPPTTTMILRNGKGEIAGMDIPSSEKDNYASRDDAFLISDDFVMFTGVDLDNCSTLEMISSDYTGEDGTLPTDKPAALWFPSPSSGRIIHEYFGVPLTNLATALVAYDSKSTQNRFDYYRNI